MPNPDPVDALVDIVHESYAEYFGEEIAGIFTDEPSGGNGLAEHGYPFSTARVSYERTVEYDPAWGPRTLSVGEVAGTVTTAIINGEPVGPVGADLCERDVNVFLNPGASEVELTASLASDTVVGPLHRNSCRRSVVRVRSPVDQL